MDTTTKLGTNVPVTEASEGIKSDPIDSNREFQILSQLFPETYRIPVPTLMLPTGPHDSLLFKEFEPYFVLPVTSASPVNDTKTLETTASFEALAMEVQKKVDEFCNLLLQEGMNFTHAPIQNENQPVLKQNMLSPVESKLVTPTTNRTHNRSGFGSPFSGKSIFI
jgi:hypothetical protein